MKKGVAVQSMTDHDLLIRLDSKVDQLSVDVRELSDGTSRKLGEIEVRLHVQEKIHDEINPKESAAMLHQHEEWIKSFKNTWRIFMALMSLVSLVIGIVLGSNNIVGMFK